MISSSGAQRALIAAYFALLAAMYGVAGSLPAAAVDHDAAVHLVTAKAIAAGHGYVLDNLPQPLPQTQQPPLFSALLALFALVSNNSRWLKLLPVAATIGWLALTYRLLLRMGATRNAALLIAAITAASPMVLFLGTNLLPATLFGLLTSAALLALLSERALAAGVLAGLATLTETAGVALIAACVLTLLSQRRFRKGTILALTSTAIAAPWFGWSLAHLTHDVALPGVPTASTIFTGLAASEKAVVLGRNIWDAFAAPISLLTGYSSAATLAFTVVALGWCFIMRRHTVPDLFLLLYSLALFVRVALPDRAIAPVLPFVLWIFWRALRRVASREALAAIAVLVCVAPLGPDLVRLARARVAGNLSSLATPPDNWHELDRLFAFARTATLPGDIVLSNHDAALFVSTGRKAIRGFTANAWDLFYAPRPLLVTPDQLSRAILDEHAAYVVLTPDTGLPESASFHTSVQALERGGVIEPLPVPGLAHGYQLFRVAAH